MIGRILPAAAICFLGFAGCTVWDAGDGGKVEGLSPARDLVLKQGSEQIAVLNTMDYAKVDDGLKAWLNAATGPLHDQLRKDAPANRQKIVTVRTKAAGAVVDAAVTAVDLRAGNARLIASVRIDLTGHDGAPSTQRKRYEAGLTRTPDGWKLTSLIMIPINGR